MKITKLHILLLLLFCYSIITIPAQSSQIEELGRVLSAQISWGEANIYTTNLSSKKGDLEGKVALAEHAQGDNREDYRDGIIGILGSLSIDPLDIASTAGSEVTSIIADVIDASVSLNEAVTAAKSVLSKVEGILYTYEMETLTRETYYKGLKKLYEDKYGPIDPNAPPPLKPPNFCIRGDACMRKTSSDPSDPEKHQQACPAKIDGSIFGIGERNCTGHIYNCDSTYICPRSEDHLTDGGCGHRYAIKDKTKHQWTYGTCPDKHAYWACDSKKHKRTTFSCGHHDYKCKPMTKAEKRVHTYRFCKWCKIWLPGCKSYIYDCNGSYSGHSFNFN